MQNKLILSLRFYKEVATQTTAAVLGITTCHLIHAISIIAIRKWHHFSSFFISALAKKIKYNVLRGLWFIWWIDLHSCHMMAQLLTLSLLTFYLSFLWPTRLCWRTPSAADTRCRRRPASSAAWLARNSDGPSRAKSLPPRPNASSVGEAVWS